MQPRLSQWWLVNETWSFEFVPHSLLRDRDPLQRAESGPREIDGAAEHREGNRKHDAIRRHRPGRVPLPEGQRVGRVVVQLDRDELSAERDLPGQRVREPGRNLVVAAAHVVLLFRLAEDPDQRHGLAGRGADRARREARRRLEGAGCRAARAGPRQRRAGRASGGRAGCAALLDSCRVGAHREGEGRRGRGAHDR
jgi:hypothetical protein